MAAEDDSSSNFFSRWSRRKVQVRSGEPLPAEPPVKPAAPVAAAVVAPVPEVVAEPAPAETPAEPPPALTLDDVARLTPESDYSAFVARSVPADVRNAAVKKLFTDPHYNVMDRLDIYIDDYSLPDPLPASMLRQMASAKFLKLFDDEEKDTKATALGDDANNPDGDSVAQSTPNTMPDTAPDLASAANPVSENLPAEPGLDHDHTDLRLQPNHAAGPPEPGRSTG